MEVFSKVQEVIFMVQVDKLTKDKEEHIIYVLRFFRAHAAFTRSQIFKHNFNRDICIALEIYLYGADQEQLEENVDEADEDFADIHELLFSDDDDLFKSLLSNKEYILHLFQ